MNREKIKNSLDKARSLCFRHGEGDVSVWMNTVDEVLLDLTEEIGKLKAEKKIQKSMSEMFRYSLIDLGNEDTIVKIPENGILVGESKKPVVGQEYKIDGHLYVLDKIVEHTTRIESREFKTNLDSKSFFYFVDLATKTTLQLKESEFFLR